MTISINTPFTIAPATKSRLANYGSLARIAAAVPIAVPTMLLASEADAAIYSQTGLSLTIGVGGVTNTALTITGAGGANVGTINLRSVAGSYAAISGGNFTWKGLNQATGGGNWFGGLPVGAGATWSNPGRTIGQFTGTNVNITTSSFGDINFGTSNLGGFGDDPQGVGSSGQTWYLLFKFKAGSANGNFGWLSFTANVNGGPNPGAGSSITITGWGWDDSGNTIGAGVTAAAVPGGAGLAGLALGAAALRGRRRGHGGFGLST